MKKLLLVMLLGYVGLQADVYVNGYFKQNGTYVAPHLRSFPDDNKYNNRSYNKTKNYMYGR